MLKAELHTHTADDPRDAIPHTTRELIDSAASHGYQVLAITLHDRQLDLAEHRSYAQDRGITLIAGVERTIQGRHVLLLNFPRAAERVSSLEELEGLKRRTGGLVIAPHPFYPAPTCLGRPLMDRHADLFDAVEFNYFYTRQFDLFNRAAVKWARAHGKPLVANADLHRLSQLGKTFSLVDSPADPDAICEAIASGKVEIRTEPLSMTEAALYFASIATGRARRSLDGDGEPAVQRGSRHGYPSFLKLAD
jgi:predicted metal-dependent phosphoesterase TrpH